MKSRCPGARSRTRSDASFGFAAFLFTALPAPVLVISPIKPVVPLKHLTKVLGASAHPHCPTKPQAVQKSQPSFLITGGLPHSGQGRPASVVVARPPAGFSSTPISRTG